MGAGYTRWFRAGGDIYFGAGTNQVKYFPMCLCPWCQMGTNIVAKPVWPSNKSFFGLYDPKPQFSYISESLARNLDWFTNFYRQPIEFTIKQKSFYRKEWFKVPNISKRQRFLDAGGSFTNTKFDETLVPCSVSPCNIEPMYHLQVTAFKEHYHHAQDVCGKPREAFYVKDRTHNFENILQNTDENIWYAARDRKFYIRKRDKCVSSDMVVRSNSLQVMADKHLVSTMRYLVAAWEEIKKEAITKLSSMLSQRNSISGILQEKKNDLSKCKHAPDFYVRSLPCWPTLVTEFVERFGGEALTSVLDGN